MSPIAHLPDKNSPGLRLVNPTEAELLEQWRYSAVSWRGALSLEGYIRREQYLSNKGLAKDGGETNWILVDPAVGDRKTLVGCSTIRKRALFAEGGEVQEVLAHGIGSVFCPPEHRNRGYASRMLQELQKILPTYQEDDRRKVLFSVLYSDIGKVVLSATRLASAADATVAILCCSRVASFPIHSRGVTCEVTFATCWHDQQNTASDPTDTPR